VDESQRLNDIGFYLEQGGVVQTQDAWFLIKLARHALGMDQPIFEVTVRLTPDKALVPIETRVFSGSNWNHITMGILYWLRIEVFPYWQAGQIAMDTSVNVYHPQLEAALHILKTLFVKDSESLFDLEGE